MCHVIRRMDGIYFVPYRRTDRMSLIGVKEFLVTESNDLTRSFLNGGSRIYTYKRGTYPYVAERAMEQNVDFMLPTSPIQDPIGCINVVGASCNIKAGLHIASMRDRHQKFGYVPYSKNRHKPTTIYKIIMPVVFHPEDVLFFDGECVSVTQLMFLEKVDVALALRAVDVTVNFNRYDKMLHLVKEALK